MANVFVRFALAETANAPIIISNGIIPNYKLNIDNNTTM
jgi:hypothetical protein